MFTARYDLGFKQSSLRFVFRGLIRVNYGMLCAIRFTGKCSNLRIKRRHIFFLRGYFTTKKVSRPILGLTWFSSPSAAAYDNLFRNQKFCVGMWKLETFVSGIYFFIPKFF